MSDSEEDVMLIGLYAISNKKKKRRTSRSRSQWIHEMLAFCPQYGEYYTLVQELRLDAQRFRQQFRMTPEVCRRSSHYSKGRKTKNIEAKRTKMKKEKKTERERDKEGTERNR